MPPRVQPFSGLITQGSAIQSRNTQNIFNNLARTGQNLSQSGLNLGQLLDPFFNLVSGGEREGTEARQDIFGPTYTESIEVGSAGAQAAKGIESCTRAIAACQAALAER